MYIKIAKYDLRVCHDLNPTSLLQVQDHCQENASFLSRPLLWKMYSTCGGMICKFLTVPLFQAVLFSAD